MEAREQIIKTLELLSSLLEEGWSYWNIARKLPEWAENDGGLLATEWLQQKLVKATYDSACLALAKVLDQSNEAMSVWFLLNLIENHPRALRRYTSVDIAATVNAQREQLLTIADLTAGLKKWRDRTLAHFDRKHLNEVEAVQRWQPTTAQIETGYKLLFDIFNSYRAILGMPSL